MSSARSALSHGWARRVPPSPAEISAGQDSELEGKLHIGRQPSGGKAQALTYSTEASLHTLSLCVSLFSAAQLCILGWLDRCIGSNGPRERHCDIVAACCHLQSWFLTHSCGWICFQAGCEWWVATFKQACSCLCSRRPSLLTTPLSIWTRCCRCLPAIKLEKYGKQAAKTNTWGENCPLTTRDRFPLYSTADHS